MNLHPILAFRTLATAGGLLLALAATAQTTAQAADLTLKLDEAVPFGIDWDAQRASAVVINSGAAPAGTFRVQLGLSHPSSLAATRPQARGSVTVDGLAPGESMRVSLAFADFGHRTIDILRLTSGRLDIRIDADNAIEETNEHNNDFGRVF